MNQVYLLCDISRQAHQQAMKRLLHQSEKEQLYIRSMEQVREIHHGMGLRTMYEMLCPDGIGRDAFVALGLKEGFRLTAVKKQIRTTYSVKAHRYTNLLNGKRFTDVNQLWSSDITYLLILGKVYYLVFIMDVYSRRIMGYSLSDNMRAENNYHALKMALTLRNVHNYNGLLIHHSDKGSQYASDLYTNTLEDYNIQISMCDEVYENTHIERVHDTIKNQYLNRMSIQTEKQLNQKMEEAIYDYNYLRPHQSLGKMAPVVFEEHIKSIPMEKRKSLEVFTVQKNFKQPDKNQLKLSFN
jgi:transposase InsO family protein